MDYTLARKIFLDCFKFDVIDYETTRVLTIAHDTDRSLLLDGRYYAPLIDTIEDDLRVRGVRCVSVARIISSIKGPLSHGNARSPEGGFARALVAKRIKALVARGTYPFSKMEERIWDEILEKTQARRVFGIQPSRELCVACHKRGVWVADVQHGVIADVHPWYSKSTRAVDPPEFLPSEFLCWDTESAGVISRWAAGKGRKTRIIGNRWVARFLNPAADDALVQKMLAAYSAEAAQPDRKTILVSLSWGDRTIPNGFIDAGLQRAIQTTAGEYRWLIRLHPNQIKGFATHEAAQFLEFFEKELAPFAEWELPTRYPLPLILRNVNLHITWGSSVCIEAAQMGVRSALLNPNLRVSGRGTNYFDDYLTSGMVELVGEQTDSIVAWIRAAHSRPFEPQSYADRDREYRALLDFLCA